MDDNQNSDNGNNQEQPVNNTADKLDSTKKRALESLAPLLGSLNVDPERKFEICMNAIRFTDNKDLVETALEAAEAIEEKGTKAEALVELITEINYLQQA